MAAGDAPSADDMAVTTRVKTAFQTDSMLKSQDIQVSATKGDVRLAGQVEKPEQKDRANELARTLEGVHSIHDELTVKR
jgi:osmotically-inducible protein OsmY